MGKEKVNERKAAEQMFVQQFMDAKTIADILHIQENTIGTWRKKYDWDKLRKDTINNPVHFQSLLAQQMLLIAEGKDATINADALSKLYKIYEGMSSKINPGIVAAVMMLYDEWLAKANPELTLKNMDYNKQFIIHIANTYGQ